MITTFKFSEGIESKIKHSKFSGNESNNSGSAKIRLDKSDWLGFCLFIEVFNSSKTLDINLLLYLSEKKLNPKVLIIAKIFSQSAF